MINPYVSILNLILRLVPRKSGFHERKTMTERGLKSNITWSIRNIPSTELLTY